MSTGWPHGMTQVVFYVDARLKPPLRAETQGTTRDDDKCIAVVKNVEGLVVMDAYTPTLAQAEAAAAWMLDISNTRLP